jgi:hypothetical protein
MTATTRLTEADRDFITRARRLAFAGTGMPELREITGSQSDAPEMVRAEALGVAQVLLLELVVIAERLDGVRRRLRPGNGG